MGDEVFEKAVELDEIVGTIIPSPSQLPTDFMPLFKTDASTVVMFQIELSVLMGEVKLGIGDAR